MSTIQLKQRILVVDNDAGVRKTIREVLETKGLEVYVAQGSGQALLQTSRQMLSESRCHLALLDLRLLNDNDQADWSGFELASEIAQKYPWVKTIFLTGYGSFELARKALADGIAVDVARKESGISELVKIIDQVLAKIECRWNLDLEPSNVDWNEILSPIMLQPISKPIAESEVLELLGKLFPSAETLHIKKLGDYSSAPSVAHGHSILMRVAARQGGRWLEEVAVKIGEHKAIQREMSNYDQFVHNQIGDYRYTFRQASAFTWHLAGIVYALIGAEIDNTQTLKEYYWSREKESNDDLDTVFQNLFGRLFRRWYAEPRTVHVNLSQEYSTALGLDKERLNRLKGWEQEEQLHFPGLARALPNPLQWTKKHARNSDIETSQHIVHGDLHSRNVFVGPNQDVWLIDFERTGPGHCLRDFIELETDIKFTLMPLAEAEPKLFYLFETALLGQSRDDLKAATILVPPQVRLDPEATRAFTAITRLRRLAGERIRYPDLRDYFWGLLYQTIFVATLSNLSDAARGQAKLSAALICERLGDGIHLRDPWPPKRVLTQSKLATPKKRATGEAKRSSAGKRSKTSSVHPVEIFCSYSHKDEKLRKELEKHLAVLQRQNVVTIWHDRAIMPGESISEEIDEHLNRADIILALFSPDFIASDYCYQIEMKTALERHDANEARVVPIILRPCDWGKTPFSRLLALPQDGKPVTAWRSRDEAFTNVASGLWKTIEDWLDENED